MRGNGAYLVRQQTTKVDDLAATARDHVLACNLAEQPAGFEVDVEDLFHAHTMCS